MSDQNDGWPRPTPPSEPPGRSQREGLIGWACALVAIGLLLIGVAALPDRVPAGWLMIVGFLLGLSLGLTWLLVWVWLPLRKVAEACRQVDCGDLSRTVPEIGPRRLKVIACTLNSMAADFQEVLLLFAHLARSARSSTRMLEAHLRVGAGLELDRGRAEEIMSDIEQMESMIMDFRYFRVRIDDDAIIDVGVAGRDGAEEAAGHDTASQRLQADGLLKGDG